MNDPRFTTVFQSRVRSENLPMTQVNLHDPTCRDNFLKLYNKHIVPASAYEVWCIPGYRGRRPDKGYVFSVDDYVIKETPKMCGGLWPEYVYKTCNSE